MARVWLFWALTVGILTVWWPFLCTLIERTPLAVNPKDVGEDWQMSPQSQRPIRVMRIIARMNMGGPAVQVSGLMRGFNAVEFDHRLYTGFCALTVGILTSQHRVTYTWDLRAFMAFWVGI